MKRRLMILGIAASLLGSSVAVAQENPKVNFGLEARGDFQYENVAGQTMSANTGFRGKFLNLRLNGHITESWSYSYRQRMGKPNKDASYFDAVDHINITYAIGAWAFTGGKQTVVVGGYEYDRAPIDIFFGSEFWYNMDCYQWGVSASYAFGEEAKDVLKLQVTQSPFRYVSPDLFGVNLLWAGSHGWVDLLHSVNVMEYAKGKWAGFLALGNQFNMGDVTLQLDWMSRVDMANLNLFNDFSVMADLSWAVVDRLNLCAKATYDVNKENAADLCVRSGTEITRVGCGAEFFPLKERRDIRLHASYCYSWGKNVPNNTLRDAHSFVSVGATWKVNIFKR